MLWKLTNLKMVSNLCVALKHVDLVFYGPAPDFKTYIQVFLKCKRKYRWNGSSGNAARNRGWSSLSHQTWKAKLALVQSSWFSTEKLKNKTTIRVHLIKKPTNKYRNIIANCNASRTVSYSLEVQSCHCVQNLPQITRYTGMFNTPQQEKAEFGESVQILLLMHSLGVQAPGCLSHLNLYGSNPERHPC